MLHISLAALRDVPDSKAQESQNKGKVSKNLHVDVDHRESSQLRCLLKMPKIVKLLEAK
jgi:hypothetical protein